MRASTGPGGRRAAGPALERQLGAWDVAATGVAAMLSAGFFLLPGLAAAETGPSVAVVSVLAAVLVVPGMVSTAELATAMPMEGGMYRFARRGFGTLIAVTVAVGIWVSLVLKAAFALSGMGAYLATVVDISVPVVAVAVTIALTAVNLFGSRRASGLELVLVVVALVAAIVVLTAGLGAIAGDGADDPATDPVRHGTDGFLTATAMIFVAYAGMVKVPSIAGEIRDPGRSIPRGLVAALTVATVVNVAGITVMVGLLGDDLADDRAPVASITTEILPDPIGLWAVVAAAVLAFVATADGGILAAARYPHVLARDGLGPGWLGRVSRRHVPHMAIVVTGAAVAVVIVLLDPRQVVALASTVLILTFGMVNGVVIVMRRRGDDDYRPAFRAPGYPWLQVAGVASAAIVVFEAGWREVAFVVAVFVLAVVWTASWRAIDVRRAEHG